MPMIFLTMIQLNSKVNDYVPEEFNVVARIFVNDTLIVRKILAI